MKSYSNPSVPQASIRPQGNGSVVDEIPKSAAKKAAGGRPPKYSGPSRPITVTLPETTLKGLESIHPDRGQAIVKLTESALRVGPGAPPLVEIVEMAANTGLLLVGPSKVLRRIPFLHLVEVAPARYLMALDSGNDFKNLELAIHDLLEDVAEEDLGERELIRQLLDKIKLVRKSERASVAEILFVKLNENCRTAVASLMQTMACLFAVAA